MVSPISLRQALKDANRSHSRIRGDPRNGDLAIATDAKTTSYQEYWNRGLVV